ncbi:hypothetical protein Tco_0020062 [Tanacetum coccineum]
MSSATSAVTYTSVYTDSEPGRAFWGADDEEISEGGIPRVIVLGYDGLPMQPVAPPSPDYIPGLEDPQTPLVPRDKDEREPMFVQAHDPDYVPEPIYPEYIPLEDGHVFIVEEQPLLYYPMDGGDDGDDDDGDSSGDDTEEDEDDEDKEDEDEEEEEEEHLALADSAIVIPIDELVFPSEEQKRLALLGAQPYLHIQRHHLPLPLLPSSGCPTQIQTLRISSTQALIDAVTAILPSPPLPPLPPSLYIPPLVDCRDDIPEFEQPPRKRLCLSTLGSMLDLPEVGGYIIEAVPEIAPMTVGEVNTRVTELAELHEHDTQDLYALLEDAQDRDSMDGGGGGLCFPRDLGSLNRIESGDSSGASNPS